MVNIRDNYGLTSLHWAARRVNSDIAKLLLAHGADPNSKNDQGKTPIDLWPELAEIVEEMKSGETEARSDTESIQPMAPP